MITAAWIIGSLFWGAMACMGVLAWKGAIQDRSMPMIWRIGVALWGCIAILFLPVVAAILKGWLK